MAAEFASSGRREMSSFQGLSIGMICIAETIASASGVLNKVGAVTAGSGPRMRPSWLMRSAFAVLRATSATKMETAAAGEQCML